MRGALIAEGREAEVFEWGPDKVLRLTRDPAQRDVMERSVAAMEAARACGAPVPGVHELVVVDGRPGFVMDRVDGSDLLASLGARPWQLRGAARVLARVHAELHDVVAPAEVAPLRDVARTRISEADLPGDTARFALLVLEGLPDGDRLCHGDYHPGNVLVGEDGPVVIDWTNATRGDPTADFARTLLILHMGALPPGTNAVIRRLQRFGRGLFAGLYLRAYRAARPVDMALVERWQIVRAAERVWEGIEEENPALIDLVDRARHRASA